MTTSKQLLKLYRQNFGAKDKRNFMTPHIIKVKANQNRVVELSSGRGIFSKYLYGVSVWHFENDDLKNNGLSKSFQSFDQAISYYQSL